MVSIKHKWKVNIRTPHIGPCWKGCYNMTLTCCIVLKKQTNTHQSEWNTRLNCKYTQQMWGQISKLFKPATQCPPVTFIACRLNANCYDHWPASDSMADCGASLQPGDLLTFMLVWDAGFINCKILSPFYCCGRKSMRCCCKNTTSGFGRGNGRYVVVI